MTAMAAAAQSEAPRRSWWSRPVVETAPRPETSSREILLGTITTGKPGPRDQMGVADQVLADGLDALHRGDVMLGRRRLEAVIEAYPESSAAGAAREELSALYNLRARSAPVDRAAEPTARWIPAQSPADANQPSGPVRSVGETPRGDRGMPSKEALARERQSRRDERWLRALSFDFQMAAGDRVFFAESSTDIGARARGVLAAQAHWLMRHPGLPVVIEAHADDSSGNRDLDTQISEQRARAVQERLVEEGVDPARIRIVAFGRDRPVATCQAPECAAQNRRVITRVGGIPEIEGGRHSTEAPALAVVPPRAAPSGRD